jgi:hypothetical protein
LSYVFQWAVYAFHLVDASFVVFAFSWKLFHYVLYCVFRFECYFCLYVLK